MLRTIGAVGPLGGWTVLQNKQFSQCLMPRKQQLYLEDLRLYTVHQIIRCKTTRRRFEQLVFRNFRHFLMAIFKRFLDDGLEISFFAKCLDQQLLEGIFVNCIVFYQTQLFGRAVRNALWKYWKILLCSLISPVAQYIFQQLLHRPHPE
uniref:(northern house mosquito) hypothetical protein n=1 Tax=Culex pipiens TaxID=7175 RepID=A0A8D8CKJ2_CULPI